MLALWLDTAATRIVHLGSGSGSDMVCVLGETPVDFLRLLAIGYDQICWGEEFESTADETFEASGLVITPNDAYRAWVTSTFDVVLPLRGSEVVPSPTSMHADDGSDPFWRWLYRSP